MARTQIAARAAPDRLALAQPSQGEGASLASLRRSGDSRPTIKDVARLAGVSAMTVSRVVNDQSCSRKARDSVTRAIELLGYEPNLAARALAANRQRAPAIAAPSVPDGGMPKVWQSYSQMMMRLLKPAD
jgi:hypothetical protein